MPITIHIEPYCTKPPELVAGALTQVVRTIRGARVQNTVNDGVMVWTGRVTISISATIDGPQETTIVEALEALNADRPKAGDPLPPPDLPGC